MQFVSRETDQADLSPRCHVSFSIAGSSLDFSAISEALSRNPRRLTEQGVESLLLLMC